MQRVFVKCLILLISIQMVVSGSSPLCPLYTWQCNSGQCIESENLCDGHYDCADKSDETVEECLFRPCPNFAFQCAYGACITGSSKCDGIVDCVDGSDETRFLCHPKLNYEAEIKGRCSLLQSMQCKSGECIHNEKLCDGQTDCMDGSDETVELCSFLKCPEYSFRCGYGACVTGLSACDGIEDCRDGSDEIPNICSNITSTTTTTVTPLPTATTSSSTTSPTVGTNATTPSYPTSSDKPTLLENHCSSMTVTRGISSVAACFYQNRTVSCDKDIRAGTIANVSCAPGYNEKDTKVNFAAMKCDADGEWTRPKMKCIAECGSLTGEQQDSTTKPWDVTILRRDYAPIFMPICSGVIVSPKIVLTAANCFQSYYNAYYTDHVFYNLVEGYQNESYTSGDKLNMKVHNISSISIKSFHRTEDLAVLVLVNYFQFSRNLKPICLPTAQSNLFSFFDENKLNIGRPIIHHASRICLEYLIASIENKGNGRKTLSYVDVYHYIPFINREIEKYEYLL